MQMGGCLGLGEGPRAAPACEGQGTSFGKGEATWEPEAGLTQPCSWTLVHWTWLILYCANFTVVKNKSVLLSSTVIMDTSLVSKVDLARPLAGWQAGNWATQKAAGSHCKDENKRVSYGA